MGLTDRPTGPVLSLECRLSCNHLVTKSLCDKITGNRLDLGLEFGLGSGLGLGLE